MKSKSSHLMSKGKKKFEKYSKSWKESDIKIGFSIYSIPSSDITQQPTHSESNTLKAKWDYLYKRNEHIYWMYNFHRGGTAWRKIFLIFCELIGFGVMEIEWSIWERRFVVKLCTFLSSKWFEIQSVSFPIAENHILSVG